MVVGLKKFFISCLFLLVASALASVSGVHAATILIDSASKADDYGFSEPRDGSNDNVRGSDAVADARGGTSALVMQLSSTEQRATISWEPTSQLTKQGVLDLGTVSFDYFASATLIEEGADLSFKIRCGPSNTSITYSFPEGLTTGAWDSKTIDFDEAQFYKTINGVQRQQTLGAWVNDSDWCHGRALDRIRDLQIGAGANDNSIENTTEVYIDYPQFGGTGEDIYNFELGATDSLAFPPSAPEGLAAEAGDGFAVITFSEPNDNGYPITNYAWSTDGVTFETEPVDASTSITIEPLINGQTYSITLKAINEVGESDASDPVSVTPQASKILPAAPIIDSVITSNKQFVINFTQPPVTGESAVLDYKLKVVGFGDFSTEQTDSPITVTGAENDSTYVVSIAAENADGIGPDSDQVTVNMPPDSDGDGVLDPNDACPNDPTCTYLSVPTLPWPALLTLLGLVGWYGKRRLMS